MGAKGSKDCCCGPCQIRSGCFLGSENPNHCCSCVPQRVCITAFDSAGYLIDSKPAVFQCPGYSATLTGCGAGIDVAIEWKKDHDALTCELCLESAILGHTNIGSEDLRLCIPMADYDQTKKQGCASPDYIWDIDTPPNCDVAQIGLGVEQLVSAPIIPVPLDEEHCVIYDRVCITVDDGISSVTERVCLDENNRWIYAGHGEGKALGIELHNLEVPPTLHLLPSTWLEITASLTAEPDCPRMSYTWRGTRTEDGQDYPWSVNIFGDRLNVCKDCTCYCECLCVTFTPSDGDPVQVQTCQNLYGWWDLQFAGFVGRLSLDCIGCERKSTVMSLTSDTHAVIGSGQAGVICPDRLIATYSVELDEETTLGIDIQCQTCRDCPPIGVSTDCCDDLIPPVLYATLSGSGCDNLDGEVVRLEVNLTDSCWSGTAIVQQGESDCVVSLNLQCEGNGVWSLGNGSTVCGQATATGTSTPCSPLNLNFILGPEGCCDGGINSILTVEVTE